jgi:hypothetical protein
VGDYEERELIRLVFMKSEDGGVTWEPIVDLPQEIADAIAALMP